MDHGQICSIPTNKTVTYARIVVDYRLQNPNPHKVRVTVGGNLLNVPGDLSTKTADFSTAKVLCNSVIPTDEERFVGIDIKNIYLQTPMEHPEYMKIPVQLIQQDFFDKYKLEKKVKN